jgi:integrase/recombinase XerD
MVPNREYLLELVREKDWSGSELARRMGVSRTEANRLLNGQRVGGKKTIAGEIVNLKMEDVDLENRVVHIIEGKGNKDRDIPINDKLYKILKNYLENIRYTEVESDRFFANKLTGKLSGSYLNAAIREAAYELGWEKEISSHVLRHSFGTNLLERGASVVSIQKLLGHTNLAVTSRYLHQDMKKLSEAVNLL